MSTELRLGTRGSQLALWQAKAVAARIAEAGGPICRIVVITTSGDRLQDAPLSELPTRLHPGLADDGPRLCGAVARALASDADLARLPAKLREAGIDARRVPAALDGADGLRRKLRSDLERGPVLASLVERVELRQDAMGLTITLAPILTPDGNTPEAAGVLRIASRVPLRIRRRGVEMRLVIDSPGTSPVQIDPILLKTIARAHGWFEALATQQATSVAALAAREGAIGPPKDSTALATTGSATRRRTRMLSVIIVSPSSPIFDRSSHRPSERASKMYGIPRAVSKRHARCQNAMLLMHSAPGAMGARIPGSVQGCHVFG